MIMKRTVLIVAGLLTGVTTAWAKDLKSNINENNVIATKHYRNAQPIVFVERQVEFFIFPDGSFDFNTNLNNNARRNAINASYNSPRVSINYTSANHRIPHISYYRNGLIKNIGSIYMNYDRYGKVTQIGNVFIDYGRGKHGTLSRVGNLKVNYNHYGEIVSTRGIINHENRFYNNNSKQHIGVNNNKHYKNDANYYHYKHNGKIKKQK